jgi:hypothetical protein
LQGSGAELLDTLQIIRDKDFKAAYLEADLKFTFSKNFEYPIIFIFVKSDSAIVSMAVAIDVSHTRGQKGLIEEMFIAPIVCEALTCGEIVGYFASIVERNASFAYYFNQKPTHYDACQFHHLSPNQQVVLNEHLALAIMKVLDDRNSCRVLK